MFYCDPCAKKLGWPDLFYISRGNCEVCKKYANCYERKSSSLPLPKAKHEDRKAR